MLPGLVALMSRAPETHADSLKIASGPSRSKPGEMRPTCVYSRLSLVLRRERRTVPELAPLNTAEPVS